MYVWKKYLKIATCGFVSEPARSMIKLKKIRCVYLMMNTQKGNSDYSEALSSEHLSRCSAFLGRRGSFRLSVGEEYTYRVTRLT